MVYYFLSLLLLIVYYIKMWFILKFSNVICESAYYNLYNMFSYIFVKTIVILCHMTREPTDLVYRCD